MRQEHLGQIVQAVSAVEQMGTVNAVYFVACGGSQAVLMAGQYIFDKETTVPSHVYTANEFMYDTPKSLNEQSLVISCSHSGNTPETVAATKLAREKGAMTIALSNAEGSIVMANPIAKEMSKDYGISARKAASILDTFSCIFQGILPYGAQMLVAVSAAASLGEVVSAFDILPMLLYPYMLLLSSLAFIFTMKVPDGRQ